MSCSNPKPYQFIAGAPRSSETLGHVEKRNAINTRGPPTITAPSSPTTRLPLADLIGNADEVSTCTNLDLDISPKDHVQWRSRRSPGNSQPMTSPNIHARKRTRSSSSPSSQLHLPLIHTPSNKLLNPQPQQEPLGHEIDPAADLWNCYAVNTRDALSATTTQHFTRLLDVSSPQSSHDHTGSVGGLRRWTSCGIEWPSAKRKRRKIQYNIIRDQIEDVFSDMPEQSIDGGNKSSTSRISLLVERVQKTLERPSKSEDTDAPSSSSPLPDKVYRQARISTSPSRPETVKVKSEPQFECSAEFPLKTMTAEPEQDHLPKEKTGVSSTTFSSDDVDERVLNFVQNYGICGPVLTKTSNTNAIGTNEANKHRIDTWDEFGDVEEISAEDFEFVASKYDKNPGLSDCVIGNEAGLYTSANQADVEPVLGNNSDEEFHDDEIDEASLVAAEFAVTHNSALPCSSNQVTKTKSYPIQRYIVTNVYEGVYTTTKGDRCPEKVVLVEDEKSRLCKAITLQQSWYDTPCSKGSYVHVVGEFSKTGQCLVNDDQNLLIVHPDHLISATAVADSFTCLRRAVLQDRIKATSECSAPLLYGTLLHEVFQKAMSTNRWDIKWLSDTIEQVIQLHIEDLYNVKLSVSYVTEYLRGKMPELQSWAQRYVMDVPEVDSLVKDRNDRHVMMSVNKLIDIEEHIWSPRYGLKGNIDATVQVNMIDEHEKRTLTVPFEIKTGKNTKSIAHRAQTALYTLLLSDRYDINVDYGILYYLETSDISRIPAIRHELRQMIIQRNKLASYVRERLSLPPMLKQPHLCNRCYAKTSCLLYHKLSEGGNSHTSGLGANFDPVVSHLMPIHQTFFRKWDELLTREESEMAKFRRELWTMLSHEREKVGRCFANVILDLDSKIEFHVDSEINRYHYSFRRDSTSDSQSFNESQIGIGEPIIISDERGHFALAKGYVTNLQRGRISVAVDRQIHRAKARQHGFNDYSNQVFSGIMQVPKRTSSLTEKKTNECRIQKFRLDKDEFSNGMATARNNLIQIMADNVFRAREIRSLVIEDATPQFNPLSIPCAILAPATQMSMNDDQTAAIEKVLAAQDFALVLGMPGTGKTTTIAHIIRALVRKGKSVLLTSYTHTAVDNILLKIREDKIDILRLGAIAKVHPQVQEFAILAESKKTTIEDIEKSYHEPQVVATTCLGINHRIFSERIFDYCIVDEASQITLPVCLGPIRMARAFILVGDHYQLPPLVQNEFAREGGLDVSLFKLLSDKHPSAVVTLCYQYRMNENIMSLSNTLIYHNRLVCGNNIIAKHALEITNISSALVAIHRHSTSSNSHKSSSCTFHFTGSCWIKDVIGPSSSDVVFINTDPLQCKSRESVRSGRITNCLEASLTAQLVRVLLLVGVSPAVLGIVTFYRSQLSLIKSMIRSPDYGIKRAVADQVEAHTADKYQGRDKDVIILNFVRSNENGTVGELLKDWRRVNVALTRAKKKIIILGSKQTLSSGDDLLRKLLDLCEAKSWVYSLPYDVNDDGHHNWKEDIDTSFSFRTLDDQRSLATSSHTEMTAVSKRPARFGKITRSGILGPNARITSPVLADILNEVLANESLE